MKKEAIRLHDLSCCHDPAAITTEVGLIAAMLADDFDREGFVAAMEDLRRLFAGEYPGYRASNTSYHDLEHTNAVVLATARLLHGLHLDQGVRFSGAQVLVALLAAMFHDAGLIQKVGEPVGSGARHMVGHEERSIALVTAYMRAHGFGEAAIADCGAVIMATGLKQSLAEIPCRNATISMLGKVLGSADLLAQMADRAYLEKLPLLYREFVEAGIDEYGSELDLIGKTLDFYRVVAKPRLLEELDNVMRVLRAHFRVRWGVDRNLYAEAIEGNLVYLEKLLAKCGGTYDCFLENLDRGGIASRIRTESEGD
ncbi:MAG: hypothetical protein OEV73_01640 [Desulfobulbaceae bacterium]|nr:hypothetical protein [Desulfobulbaceae bacterium]